MRTVDPELWSRKLKRRKLHVTRRMRFGQQQAGFGLETRIRESLRDATQEFWYNWSVGAAKYFEIDQLHKYERWRHITLLILTLVLGCAMLAMNQANHEARPPLIVSLQTDDNSIIDFKFPAVALCSNMIISRAALKNYTQYLLNHPKNKKYQFRESQIEENLLNMGALLTLALPPINLNFDMFLREAETRFNVTDIMFKLSAICSTILQRCTWRGKVVHCDSLFGTRLTAIGFCCVFNSRYQPVDFDRKPALLDKIGHNYGLGVVVRETRDDFAYVRRPAYGMELLLFEGEEFPLVEAGDVHLYTLPRNTSMLFDIRALSQYASDDIRDYTEKRRGCRLGGGGMSACLTECRRGTAEALCGCVPYALQPQAAPLWAPTCTLRELGCLNKYREKFLYLYPAEDADHISLSQERQDGMHCPHCLVQCRRQLYFAKISYSFYDNKTRLFRSFLTEKMSLENTTTIRLFYSIDHQEWYNLEPLKRWFEHFVKLGTQWMVVTGVTFLSCSEIVYHATFRWLHHFIRRTRIANMQPVATPSNI